MGVKERWIERGHGGGKERGGETVKKEGNKKVKSDDEQREEIRK